MEKIIIQITSGRGPVECCRVVAKVQERMLKQARQNAIEMEVLENKAADWKGTLLSSTILAKGANLESFVKEWRGTVLWIAPSPYRKFLKRKNWFVGVEIFDVKERVLAMDSRSQLQNKKLCLQRLEEKVLAWQTSQLITQQQSRWQEHNSLERGNAVKTITDQL